MVWKPNELNGTILVVVEKNLNDFAFRFKLSSNNDSNNLMRRWSDCIWTNDSSVWHRSDRVIHSIDIKIYIYIFLCGVLLVVNFMKKNKIDVAMQRPHFYSTYSIMDKPFVGHTFWLNLFIWSSLISMYARKTKLHAYFFLFVMLSSANYVAFDHCLLSGVSTCKFSCDFLASHLNHHRNFLFDIFSPLEITNQICIDCLFCWIKCGKAKSLCWINIFFSTHYHT